jgi:hypothetical protein
MLCNFPLHLVPVTNSRLQTVSNDLQEMRGKSKLSSAFSLTVRILYKLDVCIIKSSRAISRVKWLKYEETNVVCTVYPVIYTHQNPQIPPRDQPKFFSAQDTAINFPWSVMSQGRYSVSSFMFR